MAEQASNPRLNGLNELANRDGVDIKPTLLRVMTDLYVQKPEHTAEEEHEFVDVASKLIEQVDAATRAIVAERLASYPAAPRAVIEQLAQDRMQRGETPVETPATPEEIFEAATPAAATDAGTAAELSELFLAADSEERQMILMNLDYAALPAAEPATGAEEAVHRLELAALSHNAEGFAQEIERALNISRAFAKRLVDDASGEPVLVLAMGLGMPADVLQRVLLCLNPAISHSVLRVYELSKLYEELDPQIASRLLGLWQAAHKGMPRAPQRVAHQPVHYNDGKDRPALPARPAIRWEEHIPKQQTG